MSVSRLYALACLVGMAAVAWSASGETGLACNATPSIPLGCYWVSRTPPQRGDYAVACPPATAEVLEAQRRGYLLSGDCPGGVGLVAKVVAGQEGDRFEIGADGVRINGRLWPASAPLVRDDQGRPLPNTVGQRGELRGALLLLSQRAWGGFDGRYFGPVSQAAVVGTARPLLTW